MINSTHSTRNVTVGTMKKSMAARTREKQEEKEAA
jgi:hypothetical protein